MKPILFNTEMIRAILNNRKTVTRRAVKSYALDHLELDTDCSIVGVYNQDEGRVFPMMDYAPYRPGDILYVRETFFKDVGRYMYKADYSNDEKFYQNGREVSIKWRPSIHMPREAARIFLRVTDVRVERLWDITEEQAKAEGLYKGWAPTEISSIAATAKQAFMWVWNSTVKPVDCAIYGWIANPWVWAIEFEQIRKEAVE